LAINTTKLASAQQAQRPADVCVSECCKLTLMQAAFAIEQDPVVLLA
jgi:hypothetical protein